MKKIIAIALLAVSAISASAQMMTSRTLMKRETPTTWYVRAGMSVNMLSGLNSDDKDYGLTTGSKAGFEVDFGFHKPMGKSGAYWGMELGFANRGGSISEVDGYDDEYKYSLNAWSLKYSPFTFGYKYSITDDLKIDGHLGAFALVDLSRKAKVDGD
ncbi:MAG: PorT family protein [Muribaculaceae bacterium]|nr:PorT family protein [Muribaculaceae bacterium]